MSLPITKFTIFGERCSGTNYIEELMLHNFDIKHTNEYGNKHFFCFNEYTESTQETLFIGIVRNPIYWLNSFSKELYHIPEINRKSLKQFLFNEFYSVMNETNTDNSDASNNNSNIFLMNNKYHTYKYETNKYDLNYVSGNKYKNIFELRQLKNNYLINIMPNKVENYILINYEDLLYNLEKTLDMIKTKFELIQSRPTFENIKKYKKTDTYNFVVQRQITFKSNVIREIWNHLDVEQENSLGYFMGDNNKYFREKNELSKEIISTETTTEL